MVGVAYSRKTYSFQVVTGTFEKVAITIRWSNSLLPIGVTITLPLEFNLPSRWNPNFGVTRTPHF